MLDFGIGMKYSLCRRLSTISLVMPQSSNLKWRSGSEKGELRTGFSMTTCLTIASPFRTFSSPVKKCKKSLCSTRSLSVKDKHQHKQKCFDTYYCVYPTCFALPLPYLNLAIALRCANCALAYRAGIFESRHLPTACISGIPAPA